MLNFYDMWLTYGAPAFMKLMDYCVHEQPWKVRTRHITILHYSQQNKMLLSKAKKNISYSYRKGLGLQALNSKYQKRIRWLSCINNHSHTNQRGCVGHDKKHYMLNANNCSRVYNVIRMTLRIWCKQIQAQYHHGEYTKLVPIKCDNFISWLHFITSKH